MICIKRMNDKTGLRSFANCLEEDILTNIDNEIHCFME